MHNKHIAEMACKILAIYIFIQGLIQLTYFPMSLITDIGGQVNLIVVSFIPFMILFAVSILLWIYAKVLAEYIAPSEDISVRETPNHDYNELQAIAFSVVGLVIIAGAIPRLIQLIPNLAFYSENALWDPRFKLRTIIEAIVPIAQLTIGFFLLFSSKGLVELLNRIRGVGI